MAKEAAGPAAIGPAGTEPADITSVRTESAGSGQRGRAVVALLGLCGLTASLVQTLVVPLLPELPAILGVSPTVTPWLVTITLLTGAIATPLLARLGDTYGRRRLLLLSLSLLATGSIICALPVGLVGLLVGRAVQGAALATIPLSISIANTLPVVRRPNAAIALISAMMGVGGAIGLPAAGLIADHWGFRWLFLLLAAVAIVATIGTALVVPPIPGRREARLDVLGTILFTLVLAALLLALTNANRWGWTSPWTLGLLRTLRGPGPGLPRRRDATPRPGRQHTCRSAATRAPHQRRRLLHRLHHVRELRQHTGLGPGTPLVRAWFRLLGSRGVAVPAAHRAGHGPDLAGHRPTAGPVPRAGHDAHGTRFVVPGVHAQAARQPISGAGDDQLSHHRVGHRIVLRGDARDDPGCDTGPAQLGRRRPQRAEPFARCGRRQCTVRCRPRRSDRAGGRAGLSFPFGLRPAVDGGRRRGDLRECGRRLCAACPADPPP